MKPMGTGRHMNKGPELLTSVTASGSGLFCSVKIYAIPLKVVPKSRPMISWESSSSTKFSPFMPRSIFTGFSLSLVMLIC